ncbi:hypothetical protein ACTA71_009653 [Dictyostelium dimigraforme]
MKKCLIISTYTIKSKRKRNNKLSQLQLNSKWTKNINEHYLIKKFKNFHYQQILHESFSTTTTTTTTTIAVKYNISRITASLIQFSHYDFEFNVQFRQHQIALLTSLSTSTTSTSYYKSEI